MTSFTFSSPLIKRGKRTSRREAFFFQTYFPDFFYQFTEIVHRRTFLETLLIQSITTNDVVAQSLCCPNTEHRTLTRLHTVADGNDNVKVVIFHFLGLEKSLNGTVLSGMSEFPTYLLFFQFSFFENVADMLCDSRSSLTK